ncbi:MAG: VWA domain-containing protein [Xanthomonadaceae bacterium]|nr:VWA domain-containing protein [Xanthomonadaceae bacterium]
MRRVWFAVILVAFALDANARPLDLVIVLDNSGSMRANDPQALARTAVERLVRNSDADTRISIITFDSAVRLELPLTPAGQLSPAALGVALSGLDYRGQWTDIPAAVERALYHLQDGARPGAALAVLLLTDGIVDTGDAARDRDREGWMLDALVGDAQDRGIRIFGIAFSDAADFRVIQALARGTGAEYRRVLAPTDLAAAFDALRSAITAPPEPIAMPVVPVVAVPAQAARDTPPVAAPTEHASPARSPAPATGTPSWAWLLLAVVVALAAVVALVRLLRQRGRARAPDDEYPPGAVLMDITQVTQKPRLAVKGTTTIIGRLPALDSQNATSIVISRQSISRKHASIEWRDGEYWLVDHQSSNGTFLDDVRIDGEVQLYDGARVRFDEFTFEFRVAPDDHTLVRGEEVGGDETLVRSTTIFRTPESAMDLDVGTDLTGPREV